MRPRSRSPWSISPPALALTLVLAAGCSEPRHASTPEAATQPVTAPEPAPEPPKDNFIVGKRTQDIREATPESLKGSNEANLQITAKDPITLSGNAYVTMIGRTSMLEIEHAMNLYKATNDRYPKDYDEFMNEIIKANNIALPVLPYYQKYFYDAENHKLMIREYPELKNGPPPK